MRSNCSEGIGKGCPKVQRIDLAQEFAYFADFTRYSHWVRLKIDVDSRFDVLLSVTGVGRNTGALAAVVGAWEISSGTAWLRTDVARALAFWQRGL